MRSRNLWKLHLHYTHSTILFLVCRLDAFTRELSLFPNRDECCTEPQSNHRTKQEPASIQANYNIDLLSRSLGNSSGREVVDEVGYQGLEGHWIAKDGEDIQKYDSL